MILEKLEVNILQEFVGKTSVKIEKALSLMTGLFLF
jgi:hypothetical protein